MARVSIRNFGIKFYLGRDKDRTLKGSILNLFRRDERRVFWAVRNVNLELRDGDILGLTGPNGAGKSTLLRSITGIYGADEGSIEVEGKVSLLAISAGFLPDLSGVDNIYLNASIFGFSEKEIRRMIPKVAQFADIGEFINQPVRTYSSGMVSRLGFAVAINLDPHILLIDEVLAVGDADFRERCTSAVNDLISCNNRIVVIVSHNQHLIDSMCNKHLQLDRVSPIS